MEERIKYLIRKYIDNACTKEEFDEVFNYFKESDNNFTIDNIIDEYYRLESGANVRKKRIPIYSVAAAVLILIVSVTIWFMIGNNTITDTSRELVSVNKVTKTTERSEYKYLLLPDSTQVWLNAESTIQFAENFSDKKREVHLNGEAYFDVKHADKIPFIIYTGKVSTEVLGTAFNIKAYPNLEKVTVTVKRGKVKVNYIDQQVALLTRGQQVSISNKDKSVKEKIIKEEESTAWHEGNLIYDDYTLLDIITDLERVYDVKIDIQSPLTGNLRLTTSLKREVGIENVLEILCRLTDSQFHQENGKYIIVNKNQNN